MEHIAGEPQEGTYSGYIFGDYYLLHSYFYPHMEYSVKYSSDMEGDSGPGKRKRGPSIRRVEMRLEQQKMPTFSSTMQTRAIPASLSV